MLHHLKTLPQYFQAVIDGKKPMELRYNDRGFKSGDKCILEEYKGSVDIPGCPDRYLCHMGWHSDPDGDDYFELPEECKNKICDGYRKDIFTGRRCLIKIKDLYELTGAGLPDYVMFTYEILNVVGDK